MSRARQALRHTLAAGAIVAAWLGLVASSGGCEVAIGGTVGAFQCLPGAANVCPASQVCDPTSHQCVPSCTASGCRAGTQCDPTSNLCVPVDAGGPDVSVADTSMGPDGTADSSIVPETGVDTSVAEAMPDQAGPCMGATAGGLGCPCTKASACDSKICADSLTVTAGLYGVAGSFCTKPCCTSADCDANTVCFATGQGGDYCVEPAWLGRNTGLGTGGGGASCSLGRDCRSGLCGTGGTCIDTCCSGHGSQCANGQRCEFTTFAGAMSVDQNYSASCVVSGGMNGVCRGAGDCGSTQSCGYGLTSQPGTPTPIVATCFASTGSLTEGTTCDPMNDTCSGFCDPTAKVCTDVCFADSDCTGVAGWRCRPEIVAPQGGGSYSVLACGT